MYIETVLAPWWQKKQTSWTGPDEFPAKRCLLVCDNASVHKADELKKLMDQHGIILRFLPPNMTQWLQPLDRVVCGLIKIVQRARRGRQLAANLQQWKQEQERIVGEALLNKRPHPELTPWVPPKPTLLEGIFFYQKTHMEELQLEKTKNKKILGGKECSSLGLLMTLPDTGERSLNPTPVHVKSLSRGFVGLSL